jgi:prepilin-type N-terminal cleavage/methylation domain-containing protein
MKKRNFGFTLVELLIVIALIAVLSVAVLAAINPIEQTNKARDARVQNDASEVLSAYERYYASQQQYPWLAYTVNQLTATSAVLFRSDTYGFGICKGTAGVALDAKTQASSCNSSDANQNELVSTSELKSSFVGKDEFEPVRNGTRTNQAMWTAKAANADSVYVCYVPKAKANRSDSTKMRCISTSGVITKAGDGSGCVTATDTNYAADPATLITASPTAAVFKCIPE